MQDDLIDDEVRRSFPGWSDEEIREVYLTWKSVDNSDKTEIFASDLSHARIIRHLGWDAFKEYLFASTGTDQLDADDFIALTEAVAFVRDVENATLYRAIYGSASEMQSKKTATSRNNSFKEIIAPINNVEIAKGI